MQLEWFRAFVLLNQKKNFTDAAEEMFVSQSSFSKYIKALENQTGEALIDRSRREFRLTEQGEIVYAYARKILSEYDHMTEALLSVKSRKAAVIRLSVDTAVSSLPYLQSILVFFEKNPDFRLSLQEYDLSTAVKAFENGELDLVLCHTNIVVPAIPYLEHVFLEEELLYVGKSPEKKRPSDLSLREALSGRLILHQNMSGEVTKLLYNMGEVGGQDADSIMTTTSHDVMKAYLYGGTAYSLLTESAVNALDPEHLFERNRLKEHPVLRLGLLYQKDPPSCVRALIRYINELK